MPYVDVYARPRDEDGKGFSPKYPNNLQLTAIENTVSVRRCI
jgi:hypothetical protein